MAPTYRVFVITYLLSVDLVVVYLYILAVAIVRYITASILLTCSYRYIKQMIFFDLFITLYLLLSVDLVNVVYLCLSRLSIKYKILIYLLYIPVTSVKVHIKEINTITSTLHFHLFIVRFPVRLALRPNLS